jgi:hypothetical protein
VLEAKTPKPALQVEGEDVRVDNRMLKDDRIRDGGKAEVAKSIWDIKDASDRLG